MLGEALAPSSNRQTSDEQNELVSASTSYSGQPNKTTMFMQGITRSGGSGCGPWLGNARSTGLGSHRIPPGLLNAEWVVV